jgi:hypothetical protein
MKYVKAAAFGIFMMFLVCGLVTLIGALAFSIGVAAFELGSVPRDVSILIGILSAIAIAGAGLGIVDENSKSE